MKQQIKMGMSYQYRSAFPFFLRCRSAPTMRTWAHIFSILKVMGGGILSLATKCRRGKQSDKMTASVGFHKRNKGTPSFPGRPLLKNAPSERLLIHPLRRDISGKGISHSADRDQWRCLWTPQPLKRLAKLCSLSRN